jgi:hypothetical protein
MNPPAAKLHLCGHQELSPWLNSRKKCRAEESVITPLPDLNAKERKPAPILDPDHIVMRSSRMCRAPSELDFQGSYASFGEHAGKDHSTQQKTLNEIKDVIGRHQGNNA